MLLSLPALNKVGICDVVPPLFIRTDARQLDKGQVHKCVLHVAGDPVLHVLGRVRIEPRLIDLSCPEG